MIANAVAIAEREIAARDRAACAEYERLTALFAEPARTPAGEALQHALADYNRRPASAIRAGRFDGAERGALLDHLRRTTEEKLAVSNPKALHPSPPTPLPEGEGRKLFPSPSGRRDRDERGA